MSDEDLLIMGDASRADSSAPAAGRALPANLEAEAAFLGAALIDNRVLEDLPVELRPAHFFAPIHGRIFERVLTLVDRQMVVTPVTLKPYFEGDEALAELGGTAYLAQLTADGHGLLAPRELAQQIYDLALLRELVGVGRELVEDALDTSVEVEPMRQIEQAEKRLFEVAEGATSEKAGVAFRTASNEAIRLVEAAMQSGGGLSGKTTGLATIDSKTAGLHNSDLIILAGRPGMGKTSLA
ncbi:MAG: replicative DNA helicase, partial [Erythrobacter sp.]|nr:replicative DNA helicase [Erythrobacter sp.]